MGKSYNEYQQGFNSLKYKFRLNQMNDAVECNGSRLTDALALTIESKMNDLGFNSAPGIRRNLTRIAYENQYHPLQEYFTAVGKTWDGQDHFSQWMGFLNFEHNGISQIFFRKFMLGAVGKVMENGQNFMLVINGIQGLGKSYICRWLIPSSLQGYFVEGGLNPDSKDAKIRVVSTLLWEVGELQGITKRADLEALKNIITQQRVTIRLPYGKYDIDKPITCSFMGTVNENGAGFLNDITGNRRFAVITLQRINWDYAEQLDPGQIWAQIVAAYWAGERGMLSPSERAEQETINAEYTTMSIVAQYFHAHYEIDETAVGAWIPIAEIIDKLETNGLSKNNQRIHFMELAGILQAAGCKKSNKNPETGFGRQTCYNCIREKLIVQKPFNP